MAMKTGRNVRFKVNTGTIGVPAFTVMNGETNLSISCGAETIDVTHKGSAEIAAFLKSKMSWTVTASGRYDEGDSAIDRLFDDWGTADYIGLFQAATWNSKTYSGSIIYTAFNPDFNQGDACNFNLTGQGTGALTWA